MVSLDEIGFSGLAECRMTKTNRRLVMTLIERWRQETNTFHFLWGEMTITPSEVCHLLGLLLELWGYMWIPISKMALPASSCSPCERRVLTVGAQDDTRYTGSFHGTMEALHSRGGAGTRSCNFAGWCSLHPPV